MGRVVIPGKRLRPLEGHTEGSMGKCLHRGPFREVPSVTALTNMRHRAWQGASVLGVRQEGIARPPLGEGLKPFLARPTTTELHQSGKRRTQRALRGPHAGTLPMVKTACWEPLDKRGTVTPSKSETGWEARPARAGGTQTTRTSGAPTNSIHTQAGQKLGQ